MIAALVVGLGAVLVVLFVVSRAMGRRRELARESLEAEKAALRERDIMDLVMEEAEDIGLDGIPGADGVDVVVRLRVWHRDAHVRELCPDPSLLRFVLFPDAPAEPGDDDLRLDFEGYEPDEDSTSS